MEKVEDALYFQDNLKILVESTKRVEEINSSQRQEDLAISQEKLARSQEELAEYALLVAIVMIIPGAVSFLNDGSSVLKDMGFPNPLCAAWVVLFIIGISVWCFVQKRKKEDK